MTKKMKKLALVLVWFLIAGWAIFAIQSHATSQDTLPSESEISKLKSTYPENNNRLSAEMRDTMLNLLNKIRSKIENMEKQFTTINKKTDIQPQHYCKGVSINDSWKYISGESCSFKDAYDVYYLSEDGRFWAWRIENQHLSYAKLAEQSNNLWKHQFCALTSVGFKMDYNNEDEESEAHDEQICHIFKYNDQRYLFANSSLAHSKKVSSESKNYCQATCF